MSERGRNVILAVSTICLTLLVCELGLRTLRGISPLDVSNFRDRDPLKVRETVAYHSTLGWILKDNFDRADLHTVAYGIRRNSPAQRGPRPGNMLAVGASITEGFAVNDEQTWPAQLEALTGQPVDNAGVVGYGFDQMVLRAEQLLPVERPRVLLLGIGTPNIDWMQSTIVRGASKPFFSVDDGVLRLRNSPVPETESNGAERIKTILGYSALIDYAMSRIDPDGWYAPITRNAKGSADPVDVSCRLMERLKSELEPLGARAIVVVEPQWQEVVPPTAPTRELDGVAHCARQVGFAIVDTVAAWRADDRADPQHLATYWETDRYRHLTETGNRRIAELVAQILAPQQRQSETR